MDKMNKNSKELVHRYTNGVLINWPWKSFPSERVYKLEVIYTLQSHRPRKGTIQNKLKEIGHYNIQIMHHSWDYLIFHDIYNMHTDIQIYMQIHTNSIIYTSWLTHAFYLWRTGDEPFFHMQIFSLILPEEPNKSRGIKRNLIEWQQSDDDWMFFMEDCKTRERSWVSTRRS